EPHQMDGPRCNGPAQRRAGRLARSEPARRNQRGGKAVGMFNRRNIIKVLGLIIILLVIWFASDYWVWLENHLFLTMAIPVLLLVAWEVYKRARAAQANNKLSAAVVNQAKADQRPTADVVQLRERFEEAIAMLK